MLNYKGINKSQFLNLFGYQVWTGTTRYTMLPHANGGGI